jgi:hypothetical protein
MELNEIYKKYKSMTNMSCKEIKSWKKNPCSKEASIGRAAVNRNILLQCTPKDKWKTTKFQGRNLIYHAKKAISYLHRAPKIKSKNIVKGCGMTRNEIALKNWALDKKKK